MLKTSLPPDNSAMLEKAIAAVAAAMADPSRVKMLCALLDGRAWTATELSAAADVAPSTASGHLARLVEGQLITCLSQGRHRYYRLAGHDVAALVAMRECARRGIRVPEDVAIVGFDDIDAAAWAHPPLSTVAVDKRELGRDAFQLLLGEESERNLLLPVRLVARESSVTDASASRLRLAP